MAHHSRRLQQLLFSTTAIILSSMVLAAPALAAFDPDADQGDSTLPDTSVLYDSQAPRQVAPRPLYPAYKADATPKPALAYQPVPIQPLPAATLAPVSTPVPSHVATSKVPAPTLVAPAPAPITAPVPAPALAVAPTAGFIAPTPVFAIAPQAPAPAPIATGSVPKPTKISYVPPVAPAPTPRYAAAPAPAAEGLTNQTKTILSHIPSKLDTAKVGPTKKVTMARVSPEVDSSLGKNSKDASYEAVGLSIKVSRPGLDTNFELNRAYTALMGGDTEQAINIYKNILSAEPNNQDALFGLAATYHRLGDIDKARPYYGALLKVNPNHREGLNNFLVLVSDESPQEALAELERLEQRNPDFSPIPAQEAVVLGKLGYVNEARNKMMRAIELSPDNLTYKYNLAVMLDTYGNYADASALYRLLINASLKGQHVPATVEAMQKRLNFITTAAANPRATGS